MIRRDEWLAAWDRADAEATHRWCSKCVTAKPKSDYYAYQRNMWCKQCHDVATSSWGQRNPERSKAIASRSVAKHRETINARARQRRKDNPEATRAADRRYRKKHPERVKAKWRRCTAEERELINERRRRRYREKQQVLAT